jgi:hypothetical protein
VLQQNVEARRGLRFTVFGLASLVAVCLAVLLFVAPALAGRPTPGARYYALEAAGQYRVVQSDDVWLELRVSRSGDRLAGVTIKLVCDVRRYFDPGSREVRLSFRRIPGAAIRRDGRFALAGRNRRGRYQLSGRFVSGQYGRLRYSARMRLPLGSERSQLCRSVEDDQMVLYRNGTPPFSGCRSQRARTLLRTDTGRVFQQFRLVGDHLHSGWSPHAFACLFAIPHRRIDLGRNDDDETVELPRLAGKLLAYSGVGCALAGCQATITVRDLGSGGVVKNISPVQDPSVGPNLVWDLALKENGSLAWIVAYGRWGDRDFLAREVWALDTAGQRLLDSGPGVELESLALTDSTLTWLHGGIPRSATLN